MEQTLHGLSSRYSIAANVVRGYTTASEIEKIQNKIKEKQVTPPVDSNAAGDVAATTTVTDTKDTPSDEVLLQKKLQDMSTHMFTAMWYMTEMDIRSTIANVCVKVTHDHSVDESVRKARVDAIGIIGELYVKCNGTVDAGLNDILNQMKQQQTHVQQQANSK